MRQLSPEYRAPSAGQLALYRALEGVGDCWEQASIPRLVGCRCSFVFVAWVSAASRPLCIHTVPGLALAVQVALSVGSPSLSHLDHPCASFSTRPPNQFQNRRHRHRRRVSQGEALADCLDSQRVPPDPVGSKEERWRSVHCLFFKKLFSVCNVIVAVLPIQRFPMGYPCCRPFM